MIIPIKIGDRTDYLDISQDVLLDVLEENQIEHKLLGVDAVEYALDHPIGTERLENIVKPEEK